MKREVPELDPKHLEILQQGVEAWNEWRERNREVIPHLSGADLKEAHLEVANLNGAHLQVAYLKGAHLEGANLTEAHLEGANLREAHLEGANLVGAYLEGALLFGAHLEGAYLREAHLEEANLDGAHLKGAYLKEAHLEGAHLNGAHLEGAHLNGAHLEGAYLRGARLDNADLKNVELVGSRGLIAGQLAGTDVTGAQLPEDIAEFDSLKVADKAAKNSQSLFLIMLLGCVYSWLALATTTDAALIMNTGSSPLPIIRVVPIVGFFLVAPVFLLGAYVYFHFYLHGLWVSLSNLPAIFPDGRPLDQRAYPWLLTSLVRPNFKLLQDQKSRYSIAKMWLSVFLAWWVVPITLYLFWAQALAAHVWYMTAVHLVLFLASVAGGLALYRGAVSTLRLEDPQPMRPGRVVWQAMEAKRGAITVGALVQVFLTGMALWGPIELPRVTPLFHPYAELAGEQLSTLRVPRFAGDTARVQPADMTGRNLRFANLAGANLIRANLDSANLTGANLYEANLTGANLTGANLLVADLTMAELREANVSGAHFFGATLTRAHLSAVGWEEVGSLWVANLFDAREAPEGFWTFAADWGALCMNPAVVDSVRQRLRDPPSPFTAPEDGGPPPECVP